MDNARAATLAELAELVGGTLGGDGSLRITAAKPLNEADAGHITLIDQPERIAQLDTTAATAVLKPRQIEYAGRPSIAVDNVHASFRIIFARLHPPRQRSRIGIHPTAIISPTAKIGEGVDIHPYANLGDDVHIGPGSTIHASVQLMAGCRIGRDVTIYPNVTLYENCLIGDRVTIHSGVAIGAHGFGYTSVDDRHEPAAQLGNVVIEDDVEIGAGSMVDRGTYGSTRVGEGTKIDNMVQIAHNCKIGRHNLICAQVGIGGSSSTGDYVVLAGQAGLRDHVHIGAHAVVCGMSGITNDVKEQSVMLGLPATTEREQKVRLAAISKLPELRREMRVMRRTILEIQQLLGHSVVPQPAPHDHAA